MSVDNSKKDQKLISIERKIKLLFMALSKEDRKTLLDALTKED